LSIFTKHIVTIILKQTNGNLRFFIHIGVYLIIIVLTSKCSTLNNFQKFNYLNGNEYYNDSLKIYAQFFADIDFYSLPSKNEIKKRIRGQSYLRYDDFLLYGKSNIPPLYDVLLFYNNLENSHTHPDSLIIEQLLNDNLNNKVLFRKSFNNKNVLLYLRPTKIGGTDMYLKNDAEQIINSITFYDSLDKKLTFSQIFNKYLDDNNYLKIKYKFDYAPLKPNKMEEWNKFQYLITVLSQDTSYKRYTELLINFELNKRKYFQKSIDSVVTLSNDVYNSKEVVLNKIKELSKNTRVVMLNENHWYPNHRILAKKLLRPLKEIGYSYLAVEAINKEKDTSLNSRGFPIKSTGYYTREPFFSDFIREAIKMGYKIVSYDEFESEDRELSQAKNIYGIIEQNPNAKIFVYAGLDHIYESNPNNKKRMSAYFKELSGINPLTIDQAHLFGDTKGELIMFKSDLFKGMERINTNVDYFVINHFDTSLDEMFDEKIMTNFKIDENFFSKKLVKSQELLISIYLLNEYLKYKSSSLPVINKIITAESLPIDLKLPVGKYYLLIRDANDLKVVSKQLDVN